MMDAQLNLEFLQALLFRGEVINIRIGQVICFSKETHMVVDNAVRQRVQLFRIPAEHTGPKHVVIVLTVVKANQTILRQLFNIRSTGVNQPSYRLVITSELPVDQEEVREHLAVEKYDGCFLVFIDLRCHVLLRFEVHLRRDLQAGIGLIRAVYGKGQNCIAHVIHIIGNPALVGFIHNMGNKVNAGFGVGTDFFCEGFLNEYPQVLLILNLLHIDHCFFSLQW